MTAMEEEMRKAEEEIKQRKEEAERSKVIGASVRYYKGLGVSVGWGMWV